MDSLLAWHRTAADKIREDIYIHIDREPSIFRNNYQNSGLPTLGIERTFFYSEREQKNIKQKTNLTGNQSELDILMQFKIFSSTILTTPYNLGEFGPKTAQPYLFWQIDI